MENEKIKELEEIQDMLETESAALSAISATFGALEIAQSEGDSEISRRALYILSIALKQTTERINKLICDMQAKLKELTNNE